MPVTVIATLRLRPGLADAVLGGLREMLPDTRAFSGCESIVVVQGMDDPDLVILVEQWAARSDHEAYLAWRAGDGSLASMAEVLVEPPTFTYCTQTEV